MAELVRHQRIGLIANTAWNIFNFRLELIKGLMAEGYEVYCIAPEDGYELEVKKYCTQFIPLKRLARKGTSITGDAMLFFEFLALIRKWKFDLLMCYTIKPNIYATFAAGLYKVPVLNTITGLGFSFLQQKLVHKVVVRLYRYALSLSSHVIFQNADDRDLFTKLSLVRESNSSIIRGSGIDVYKFSPAVVMELLQAFIKVSTENKMGQVILHIVGDTDPGNPSSVREEDLVAYRNHPLIRFHGYHDDVIPFIQQADVVILPSYREGIPRAILEAMSMARPVIVTDVPGCRDVVVHGVNGYLVGSGSTEELAAAIHKFGNLSASEKQNMGQQGRTFVLEKFSSEVVIKAYLVLVKRFLA
ncbi:MAG: glycosyltransferase family 4 protein [Saprospiraceae bacterium]|nr:glycosyltransferase family 4 protein [Saprospiraceae bacterium]